MDRLIERKQMSTKTTFKRIALVAVAALGFGMLSVVPSSAAAPTITASASVTSGTYKALQLVPSTSDSIYTITSSGVGTIAVPVISGAATAGYKATSGISATGATYFHSSVASDVPGSGTNTVFAVADTLNMSAYSAVAGTQTITVTGNVSGAITSTITWGAAPTISTAYSTAAIAAAADVAVAGPAVAAPSNVPATVALYTTALNFPKAFVALGAPVATVGFTFNGGPATAFNGQAWTAMIASGPGLLDNAASGVTLGTTPVPVLTASSYRRSVGQTAVEMAGVNTGSFGIYADNTAGTSVINLYAGSTLWKTFTVTFYGSAAKVLVEVQHFSIAKSGTKVATPLGVTTGATGGAAVVLKVVDSLGFVVPGQAVTGTSSDPLILAGSSVVEDIAAGDFGAGYYNADVTPTVLAASGASATVTYSIGSGTTKISSEAVKFTLGGSIAKTTVTTDASSYAPGAPVVLTVTAVDASGNPTYDNQAALASLTANKAFITGGYVLATLANGTLVGGKYATKANTLFAPATEGDWTMLAVGLDADATKISVTGTVTGSSAAAVDAAAEATDAANAATDAANAAAEAADAATAAAQDASDAVAALSAQVATLISALRAQLTSLTNLVIKIQKKVKA